MSDTRHDARRLLEPVMLLADDYAGGHLNTENFRRGIRADLERAVAACVVAVLEQTKCVSAVRAETYMGLGRPSYVAAIKQPCACSRCQQLAAFKAISEGDSQIGSGV